MRLFQFLKRARAARPSRGALRIVSARGRWRELLEGEVTDTDPFYGNSISRTPKERISSDLRPSASSERIHIMNSAKAPIHNVVFGGPVSGSDSGRGTAAKPPGARAALTGRPRPAHAQPGQLPTTAAAP
ncbi:hypothetical protein EVAR_65815_1 [Eumeta japonica]|uniref:Uncharacterized protein n=1 Tax=Eumeta variegata TaxID=151549 RepID=A0A4C1ZNC1_EUMVA|nr:hypothetical protein EVAR_65815_1 [Eumeta japonica]